MKRWKLATIILFVFLLSGCVQKSDVTEEQSDAVAEYMAGLLLKYDEEYDRSLTPIEEIKATETNIVGEEATDVPTPTVALEDNSTNSNSDENDVDNQKDYTLSEVIGEEDFDIKYKGYKMYDTYPEDSDSFSLTPREGYQLLVATFEVINKTDSSKKINLRVKRKEIKYQLDINVGTVYKPFLTLLVDDLQYLDISLDGGKSTSALLVFEVSKNTKLSDINLIVSRNERSEIIEFK